MLLKIKQKFSNMNTKDRIVFWLWLMVFILLLSLVIVMAVIKKDTHTIINEKQKTEHVVVKLDEHNKPIKVPEAIKVYDVAHEKTLTGPTPTLVAGTKDVYAVTTPAHDAIKIVKDETYATVVATMATLFGLAIFGSMLTTVIFKYNERRMGGQK